MSCGIDDYVTKPFDMPELLARVSALLRRRGWHGVGEQVQLGHLKVDFRRHLAWQDENSVSLTNLELKLLRYLVENPNKPVSRNELLSRVWGISSGVQTRTVDVFIGRLRKLIDSAVQRDRPPSDVPSTRPYLRGTGVWFPKDCRFVG